MTIRDMLVPVVLTALSAVLFVLGLVKLSIWLRGRGKDFDDDPPDGMSEGEDQAHKSW